MSAAYIAIPLIAAYTKMIRTLSLETTPANVVPSGVDVLWPSRTHLAFRVKSILTSQVRWPVARRQPFGAHCPAASISKATPTLYISLASALAQISLPFDLSSRPACSTSSGISIPFFLITFLTRDFIA